MNAVFKNGQLQEKSKIRILKCYVWSVLLYRCDAWTISENIKRRVEAVEMWFIRRILKISWIESVSNEKALERARVKRQLLTVIR